MPVLYRASFGYLMRHPWQLALALTGICVGVAVVVAVDLANDSSRRAFRMSMDAVNGEATHQIVAGPAGVDESLYVALRVDEGLRNIAPVVEGYVDAGSSTVLLLGVDLFAERGFRGYVLRDMNEYEVARDDEDRPAGERPEAPGASPENFFRRMLTEPGAVVMSGRAAASLALSAGAAFDLQSGGKTFEAHVAALTAPDDDRGSQNLLITDIATAQQWLGHQGTLSRIDVRIEGDPGSDEYLTQLARIRAVLPEEALLLPAAARTESVGEMSEAFMTNLTAMSLLALLIGVFLIYNSVSFAVLQRRSLFGVLRALGLTRAETFRLILLEALVLGVVGACLGLGLGFVLGHELLVLVSQSINDLYYVVNVTDVTASPASLIRGFTAGLGATLLAAAVPALEAASCRPRLALSRSSLERRSGRLAPRIALAGILTVILGLVVIRVSGTALVGGLIAVFMLVFGLALCVPVVVRSASWLLAPASRVGGLGLRLAVAGTGASLSRTGVAIVALAVAVSATIGVSIMVDSFRSSVGTWLDDTLRSDIYVGVARGTLDPGLVDELTRLPEVAEYSISRRVWLEADSGRTRVTAIEMASEAHAGVTLEGGDPQLIWREFEQQAVVLVSGSYAYRHGSGRGGHVSLRTPSGDRTFPIAGTYRSYDANLDAVLMSRNTYVALWNDDAIGSLGIYLSRNAEAGEVMRKIRQLSEGRQALLVSSNRELRERSMQIFDRTFVITDVLYWLALSVAATGILGAMLALQLERARELAIYRALGMTPGQLGRMVVVQSAFIGFLSGVAAVPLGLVMAVMLIDVINRRAFGWQMDIFISPAVLVTAILLATVTATAAGVYPAWRAAQAKPALAMREE